MQWSMNHKKNYTLKQTKTPQPKSLQKLITKTQGGTDDWSYQGKPIIKTEALIHNTVTDLKQNI